MNLFYQPSLPEGIFYLDVEESRHCIKVLRKKQGDSLRLTDGKGFFYDAIITKADSKQCYFEVTGKTAEPTRSYKVHVAISPTKNSDRIEWFVEKAVEIGVDTITLIDCKNTERSHIKLARLEKVAVSAMKQSLKASVPTIQGLATFNDVVDKAEEKNKFIAFVDQANPQQLKNIIEKDSTYLVLIGPEGDFSDDELRQALQHGFLKVSLGSSRLRTETAGLVACHIINLFNS